MWDRQAVMAVHQEYNHANKTEASRLLGRFRAGNTIGNEGCLLTSLAMVLRLLDQNPGRWSPKTLNVFAHKQLYYTLCGLSMATLYADLVCEASNGGVQLLLKEEYLSGKPDWPPTCASTCMPIRAYRTLSPGDRRDVVVMIKTGTYDDTVGSHFLLVDQANPGSLDDDDFVVQDPAEPLPSAKAPWLLSDSSRHICQDQKIREAWRKAGLRDLQLAGVWVFARWLSRRDATLGGTFLRAMAQLLPGDKP
jgi:hypothetical protein